MVPDTHAFSITIRLEVIMGLSFGTITFDLMLWLVYCNRFSELGNKQTTTLVFKNKKFNLK